MEALVAFSLQAGLIVLIWSFVAALVSLGYSLYKDYRDL